MKPLHTALILSLATTLLMPALPSFAQEQKTSEVANISGQIRFQDRFVDEPGKPAIYSLRGQFRVDGWVDVTEDGCLKIRGRVSTGPAFNNEWVNTGIGAANESDLKLAIRHLYIDRKCLDDKVRVELGALPIRSSGSLGLTAAGWLDGLRVTITEPEANREWAFSVGQIGDPTEPSVFKRDLDDINHYQLEAKQGFGKDAEHTVYGAVTKFENTIITRAGIEAALRTYANWLRHLTSVGIEAMATDGKFIGGMLYTTFDLKNWSQTRLFYARLSAKPEDRERLGLLYKNFYGFGDNIYFETNRNLFKSVILNLRGRAGMQEF